MYNYHAVVRTYFINNLYIWFGRKKGPEKVCTDSQKFKGIKKMKEGWM